MKINKALMPILAAAATTLAAASATPPLNQPLTGWQTWPSSGIRTLPATPTPDGVTNAAVAIVAPRGATVSATFALRASSPLDAVSVSVDGLDGLKTDLRLVKCWYQDANAWFAMRRGMGDPVLVPELLLHDDSLVQVDHATKTNRLRTSPTGQPAQYAPPSPDVVVADDAPALLPFPIAEGETRELHLLVDVPASAAPGLLNGKIAISADGKALGHLDLAVRIIDFTLPTAYGRFLDSKYDDGKKVITGRSPAPVKSGYNDPFMAVAALPTDRLTPATCAFLASCGLTPVIPPARLGDAASLLGAKPPATIWLADAIEPSDGPAPDATALADTARKAVAAGFSDARVFVRGCADRKALSAALDAVDVTGALAWTFAEEELYSKMADVIAAPMRHGLPLENAPDGRPMMGDPYGFTEYSDTRQVDRWHALGTPYYLCVKTDAGIENPAFWRRRLGMECYWLGYDGFILPSLVEPKAPWTDASSPTTRSRTFLYPTKTGFVPTLAWEGVRDAVVDARCLSAVTRLATEARYLAHVDTKIAIEGRKALSWVEWIKPKTDEPDTMRLDALAWIDRLSTILRKAVK